MALIAIAEIRNGILWPLVRLGKQQPVVVAGVDPRAQVAQEGVGLRQVLAVGAFAFVEVRDGVQSQPVHAGREPEVHRA